MVDVNEMLGAVYISVGNLDHFGFWWCLIHRYKFIQIAIISYPTMQMLAALIYLTSCDELAIFIRRPR